MDWDNKVVGWELVAPDQLLAHPQNFRRHPARQREALRGSLNELGMIAPVLVNQTTGRLLDGHARVEEYLRAGIASVPVLYVSVPEDKEELALLSLDPIAAMAEVDAETLRSLLEAVDTQEQGLRSMLDDLAKDVGAPPLAGDTDPDEAPEPPADPITKPGDLWLLGEHRVLCGDATDAADVERVMDGATCNLMVTDPPYGVSYEPGWRNDAFGEANRSVGTVANDNRADWRDAWGLFGGDVAYVWHAGTKAAIVADGLVASGFEIRGQIIWAKQHFAISRGHYHIQHEPCWYAVRRGDTASWAGDRSQTTLWSVNNGLSQGGGRSDVDAQTGHGTQKPVEVMARPIRNHEGDVYDPFLGSGTTLIAAEQTGRICYGMEIDPRYCDVIVNRWEAFTGKTATRSDS